VDRHFEGLGPLLLPLLIVDRIRGGVAWWKKQKKALQPTAH